MSNKIIIFAKDSYGKIPEDLYDITDEFIEPTEFLVDGIHDIDEIYKDTFEKDSLDAKELLEELIDISKRKAYPYAFSIAESIHKSKHPIVAINASIVSNEDIKFIAQMFDNILFVTEVNNTSDESHYVIGIAQTGQTYVSKSIDDFKQEAFDCLKNIHTEPEDEEPSYILEEVQ